MAKHRRECCLTDLYREVLDDRDRLADDVNHLSGILKEIAELCWEALSGDTAEVGNRLQWEPPLGLVRQVCKELALARESKAAAPTNEKVYTKQPWETRTVSYDLPRGRTPRAVDEPMDYGP